MLNVFTKNNLKKKLCFYIVIKNSIILKATVMATMVNLFIGGFNILILNYCKNIIGNSSQGQSLIHTFSVVGILTIDVNVQKKESFLSTIYCGVSIE